MYVVRESFTNDYKNKSAEEVKKLSLKVFDSLESVVKKFEEFTPIEDFIVIQNLKGFSGKVMQWVV